MLLIETLDQIPASLHHGAITIGNFDGVHLGHAQLISRILAYCGKHGGLKQVPSIVFTFHPHPARVLQPLRAPQPLTWINRKARLLGTLGIDAVIACPTDPAILAWSPETFFQRILCDLLHARHIVEGVNFRFGCHRCGDTQTLQSLCDTHDMTCELVEPLVVDGEIVSSSRIRRLIGEGRLREANRLLTCPYRIRGMVVHGLARGRKLGFPTANLEAIDTLLPGFGVYAARAVYLDRVFPAAVHIGPNRTFHETTPKVEVHILDFKESIYGKMLKVDFLEELRPVVAFASQEELIARMRQDMQCVREIVRTRMEYPGNKSNEGPARK